jgi:hypothetical protein
MKRALLLLVAVIALMLVYPTTTPAATPGSKDTTPTMEIMTPRGGDDVSYSDDGDEGDADDLAGLKDRKRRPDDTSSFDFEIRLRSWAEVWRMYFVTYRLYR